MAEDRAALLTRAAKRAASRKSSRTSKRKLTDKQKDRLTAFRDSMDSFRENMQRQSDAAGQRASRYYND